MKVKEWKKRYSMQVVTKTALDWLYYYQKT